MATPTRLYVGTGGLLPGIHIRFLPEPEGPVREVLADELETHLQQEQFLGFTKLNFYLMSHNPNYMEGIASAIRNSLPNLKVLAIFGYCGKVTSDASLAVFLQNFSPRLSAIEIYCLQEDMPKTFQTLGRFQQLEEVRLMSDSGKYCPIPFWCNPQSFGILTDSLEKMPLLRSVNIQTPLFFHPQDCLEELFTVLARKEHLARWHFRRLHLGAGSKRVLRDFVGDPRSLNNQLLVKDLPEDSSNPYTISQELWDILNNGPTLLQQLKQQLNQAHRRGIFPDSIRYNNDNKQAWVEAMVFFKDGLVHVGEDEDTFDVFHFLVAQLPPDLLITACLLKIDKERAKMQSAHSQAIQTQKELWSNYLEGNLERIQIYNEVLEVLAKKFKRQENSHLSH